MEIELAEMGGFMGSSLTLNTRGTRSVVTDEVSRRTRSVVTDEISRGTRSVMTCEVCRGNRSVVNDENLGE